MRSCSILVLVLVLAVSTRATELTDLGQGLGYLRVHALDTAVKPLAGSNALVLDLRHAMAGSDTLAPFFAALSARPAGSRLFVLVGPETPVAIAEALKGNLITLGIKGARPEPQVVVHQSAAADRAAYQALDAGTALAELISGKIEKERFDEATLMLEFKNGNHDAQPTALPPLRGAENGNGGKVDAPGAPHANGAAPSPAPPVERPVDRVLQRAVHLHRALQALKR